LLFEFVCFYNFWDLVRNNGFQITGKLSFEKTCSSTFFARLFSFFVYFCTIALIALNSLILRLSDDFWGFIFHAYSSSVHNFTVKNFVFFFLQNHFWSFPSLNRSLSWKSNRLRSDIVRNPGKTLVKHIGESLICHLIRIRQNQL